MDDSVKVQAGKLFCVSRGEYSDFSYRGHYLALVDITTELFQSVVDEIKAKVAAGEIRDFLDAPIDMTERHEVHEAVNEHFFPTLVRRGAVMVIDCTEIHYGSYGQFEITGVEV